MRNKIISNGIYIYIYIEKQSQKVFSSEKEFEPKYLATCSRTLDTTKHITARTGIPQMAYWNARRTLASTVARALSSCAAGSASRSRSRSRLAFALGAAKQTLPVADSVRLHPVRTKSSGSGYSPLNDPSPNWSNRPPKETILLDGCDYEHWLIVMEFPDNPKPSEDEMVNTYVKTLAHVLGR